MHRKRLRSSEYEEALAPGHPKQLMASWRTLFCPCLIEHLSFVASSECLRRQSAFLLTFRILCRHSVYTFLVQHLSHNQHFFSNRLIFIFCPRSYWPMNLPTMAFTTWKSCSSVSADSWWKPSENEKWKDSPFTLIFSMTMSFLSLLCVQLVLHSALTSKSKL